MADRLNYEKAARRVRGVPPPLDQIGRTVTDTSCRDCSFGIPHGTRARLFPDASAAHLDCASSWMDEVAAHRGRLPVGRGR
jgi:hypothetical protein